MKTTASLLLTALVIILAVSACGKSSPPGTGAKPKNSAPPAVLKKAPAPPERHNLSSLKPLEIVPAEKVASLAEGSLLGKPVEVGKNRVEYYIKLPNAATEKYFLAFETAAFEQSYQLPLWKEQKKEIENISGLWDEAYFALSGVRPGGTLMVIRKGDIGMEIGGDRKDVLMAIAKEAIAKLK